MTTVVEHQDVRDQLPSLIQVGARKVQRNYSEFVEVEDLEQEGWLWAETNTKTIERLLTGEKVAPGRLLVELMRAMDRAARTAKAILSGYKPSDSYWYSDTVIAMVLTEIMQTPILASVEREERVGTTDPSHGNNWPVIVADVESAWHRCGLEPMTQTVLAQRYGCSFSLEEIAELTNQSRRSVQRRLDEGMQALADELNQTIDVLREAGCEFDSPERGELPEE